MRLSAPIFRLKRRAKILAREEAIPLNKALKRIAADEGFSSWSLLASKAMSAAPSRDLLGTFKPGDIVLLGARPGHGKTMLGFDLIAEAIKAGRQGAFFTLEYNDSDILKRLDSGDGDMVDLGERFVFDSSDDISADHIIERLKSAPQGTIAVVDYLQLLDQKRKNPDLMTQVSALKKFAAEQRLIIVFLSQIDRTYDLTNKVMPDIEDVRLPNPLDLSLFDKTCFMHDGEIQVEAVH